MNNFDNLVSSTEQEGLYSSNLKTIQVNVGLKCNKSCVHCHLEASPERNETMSWSTMQKIIDIVLKTDCEMVDITGGSPELNLNLKRFIADLKCIGVKTQVRTNLVLLSEPEMAHLVNFFCENKVILTGSMPCYLKENVDAQRGTGTYDKSIEAIRILNEKGYGMKPDLILNLVYNPGGTPLPPVQDELEKEYKREFIYRFGIDFSNLITITNMPIGRFGKLLEKNNKKEDYLNLLTNSYNPNTVNGLMCKNQISIGWDGTLYDCDFNLALGLTLNHGAPNHINRFDFKQIENRRIVTGEHCFGCTAGLGSSCGGALV